MDDDNLQKEGLRRREALAAWQHYSNTAGADKETMVTIATWLLAFSAAAVGYALANVFEFQPEFKLKEPVKLMVLAAWGVVVSVAGAIVVLVYAGYATGNWAKADEIARTWGLEQLLTDTCKATSAAPRRISRFLMPATAFFARPIDPRSSLAPVFWIFLGLVALSLAVHASLLAVAFWLDRSSQTGVCL